MLSCIEPCLCGATDCPSCGPAQGFAFRTVRVNGRLRRLPREVADAVDEDGFSEPEPDADEVRWARATR